MCNRNFDYTDEQSLILLSRPWYTAKITKLPRVRLALLTRYPIIELKVYAQMSFFNFQGGEIIQRLYKRLVHTSFVATGLKMQHTQTSLHTLADFLIMAHEESSLPLPCCAGECLDTTKK